MYQYHDNYAFASFKAGSLEWNLIMIVVIFNPILTERRIKNCLSCWEHFPNVSKRSNGGINATPLNNDYPNPYKQLYEV